VPLKGVKVYVSVLLVPTTSVDTKFAYDPQLVPVKIVISWSKLAVDEIVVE